MQATVRDLQPLAIWNHFADINAIPRGSKKENQIIAYMQQFAAQYHLPCVTDEVGNVIIKKPATAGMEHLQTVCLQSHLDMVHQKNNDTVFDFNTQGIDMYVDGDWVKARGTTLGADNGIGVSIIMALLTSSDIPHPALEALFTIDEETGMTGALGLQGGLLDASILLNIDTEDDCELTIGCAGGIDVTGSGKYPVHQTDMSGIAFSLQISGLTGGHSGMDIHKGRGNANKIMNAILLDLSHRFPIYINSIDGGSLRNAIPRESKTILVCAQQDAAALLQAVADLQAQYQYAFLYTDPNLRITLNEVTKPTTVIDRDFQFTLLRVIASLHHGIYRMDSHIEGLVQTSNNVSRILVADGSYSIQNLTRSSLDSEKYELANALQAGMELLGAHVDMAGGYPGWTPKPDAPIVQTMSAIYQSLYQSKPHVNACHAGLECGILGTNYPHMDMVSFGPNITGAHSPDEKVQISSVQKIWDWLLQVLLTIPHKN